MEQKNESYVYELSSSATPTIPFYVGKGIGNRMYNHKWAALRKVHKNRYLQNKILKLLKENHDIVYTKIIENISNTKANLYEIKRIADLKFMGFKLCNLTKGGDGGSPNEEIRKKISKTLTGRKLPPFTEEHKRHMSEAAKNRQPVSEEVKKKISKNGKGKHSQKQSLELKKKRSGIMKLIWIKRKYNA